MKKALKVLVLFFCFLFLVGCSNEDNKQAAYVEEIQHFIEMIAESHGLIITVALEMSDRWIEYREQGIFTSRAQAIEVAEQNKQSEMDLILDNFALLTNKHDNLMLSIPDEELKSLVNDVYRSFIEARGLIVSLGGLHPPEMSLIEFLREVGDNGEALSNKNIELKEFLAQYIMERG